MSETFDEGPHQRIIREVNELLKKQGQVSSQDMENVLNSIEEEYGEESAKVYHKAMHDLFDMGVLRVVPKAIPIKDKGLILSSKIVIRPPTIWGKSTIGTPAPKSKIPRSLKQRIESAVAP